MKFRKDGSLSHVAITETTLHELFRSSKPAVPADGNISSGECEAYLCSSKENDKIAIFVAFWEVSGKICRIYLPDRQPLGNTEYHKCVDKAHEFLKCLGFTMEPVNLNYSTAMRQVIWSSVKIFKPVRITAKGSATANTEKTRINSAKVANETLPDNESKNSPHKSAKLGDKVLAVETAPEQAPVMEKIEGESDRQENIALMLKIQELSNAHTELGARSSEMETEIENLKTLLEQSRFSLETEQTENRNLRCIHGEESEKMAAEIRSLKENIVELEHAAEINQAGYEKSLRELEQKIGDEQRMRQDAESGNIQVVQEKEQAEQIAAAALDSARLERRELIEKLESRDEEQRRVKDELEMVIAAARSNEEQARCEAEKLRQELQICKELYEIELSAMRIELRRLVEDRSSGPREGLVRDSDVVENLRGAEESDENTVPAGQCLQIKIQTDETLAATIDLDTVSVPTEDSSVFPQLGEGEHSTTTFMPNMSLAAIPCMAPDSIVTLFESSNKIQTVPSGFKIQKSGGYICAVKRNSVPEIFLVWQMLESKESLIYTPQQQPGDDVSFRQILQDALFYFESVGFMMSEVDLNSHQIKAGALKKIQIDGPS